jgi:hypothetical protein
MLTTSELKATIFPGCRLWISLYRPLLTACIQSFDPLMTVADTPEVSLDLDYSGFRKPIASFLLFCCHIHSLRQLLKNQAHELIRAESNRLIRTGFRPVYPMVISAPRYKDRGIVKMLHEPRLRFTFLINLAISVQFSRFRSSSVFTLLKRKQ